MEAKAAPIDIGSGSLDLPEGWVTLQDNGDCFSDDVGIYGGFRNALGTIWITHSVRPPDAMQRLLTKTANWRNLEAGKISGFDYAILAEPGKEHNLVILFPEIRTYFQIVLTENGSTDGNQMLAWYKPPQGEQFQIALAEVKKTLFAAYTPTYPSK